VLLDEEKQMLVSLDEQSLVLMSLTRKRSVWVLLDEEKQKMDCLHIHRPRGRHNTTA